jgi:hypothetical protein
MSNFAIYTKIGTRALLKGFAVGMSGIIFCFITFLVGIYLLSDNQGGGVPAAGHAGILGALAGLYSLFIQEFWSALLLFASLGFIYFYFVFAAKTTLFTVIHLVWKNKLADFITPKIGSYIQKLLAHQPDWLKKAGDKGILKMKLVQEAKSDSTLNKVQQKILVFGIRKIELNEHELQNLDSAMLTTKITETVKNKISEFSNPSLLPFWVAMSIQVVLLILAIVKNHQ